MNKHEAVPWCFAWIMCFIAQGIYNWKKKFQKSCVALGIRSHFPVDPQVKVKMGPQLPKTNLQCQGVYNWKSLSNRLWRSWYIVPLPVDPEVEVNIGSQFSKVNIYCLRVYNWSLNIGFVLLEILAHFRPTRK